MGCVPAADDYLVALRLITEREHSVLIFDEVMTGFRLAFGGAQELYNIRPDLTTMGKIIGGGVPVAAYAGSAELMNNVAPLGPVYQAGTLAGNPLAMSAGIATLKQLSKAGVYTKIEALAKKLVAGLQQALSEAEIKAQVNSIASLSTIFFAPDAVNNYGDAKKSDTKLYARYFREMLNRGIFLAPSQFEAAFVSAAHTESDIERTIAAAKEALRSISA